MKIKVKNNRDYAVPLAVCVIRDGAAVSTSVTIQARSTATLDVVSYEGQKDRATLPAKGLYVEEINPPAAQHPAPSPAPRPTRVEDATPSESYPKPVSKEK